MTRGLNRRLAASNITTVPSASLRRVPAAFSVIALFTRYTPAPHRQAVSFARGEHSPSHFCLFTPNHHRCTFTRHRTRTTIPPFTFPRPTSSRPWWAFPRPRRITTRTTYQTFCACLRWAFIFYAVYLAASAANAPFARLNAHSDAHCNAFGFASAGQTFARHAFGHLLLVGLSCLVWASRDGLGRLS